jgi:Holliday junction resolvase-like predicted endonuclease
MAARHLLMTRAELHRYPVRFDVIAMAPGSDSLKVQWLKGAFGT